MCRAGGRRCPGSAAHGRVTAAARQRKSRAQRALAAAKAAGNTAAAAAATERVEQATAELADLHTHHTDQAHPATEPATTQDSPAENTSGGDDDRGPAPVAAPVSGALSDRPLADNGWGSTDPTPIHYHDDGPVGAAVRGMGEQARMDVDGQPLADVVGKLATDVVKGRRTPQEGVDALKALRDRLPENSRARKQLDIAVWRMDAPHTPPPATPETAPQPLRDLAAQLHAVPMVRKEPDKEMAPLLSLMDDYAAGRTGGPRMVYEIERLANRRHESLGDCGKFAIDDAVRRAVTALEALPREALTRERH